MSCASIFCSGCCVSYSPLRLRLIFSNVNIFEEDDTLLSEDSVEGNKAIVIQMHPLLLFDGEDTQGLGRGVFYCKEYTRMVKCNAHVVVCVWSSERDFVLCVG